MLVLWHLAGVTELMTVHRAWTLLPGADVRFPHHLAGCVPGTVATDVRFPHDLAFGAHPALPLLSQRSVWASRREATICQAGCRLMLLAVGQMPWRFSHRQWQQHSRGLSRGTVPQVRFSHPSLALSLRVFPDGA